VRSCSGGQLGHLERSRYRKSGTARSNNLWLFTFELELEVNSPNKPAHVKTRVSKQSTNQGPGAYTIFAAGSSPSKPHPLYFQSSSSEGGGASARRACGWLRAFAGLLSLGWLPAALSGALLEVDKVDFRERGDWMMCIP